MKSKLIVLLTVVFILSCGPQVHFIPIGSEKFAPKPKEYEVQVFFDDVPPQKEYKVIGMVFYEDESGLLSSRLVTHPKIINRLKKKAKKQGADAIIISKITSENELVPDPSTPLDINVKVMKRAEAKAIHFIDKKKNKKNEKELIK